MNSIKILFVSILMVNLCTSAIAQENDGLNVGVIAPDFEKSNYKNETIKLSDIYKKGNTVLLFYRGGWCPYCNKQLQEYQSRLEEFKALDVSIIAVSVDKAAKAAQTVESNSLGIEVVSNPQGDILEAYNLIYQVPDELNEKYLKEYKIDLEASSGRKDHVIAVPATFIIGTDGQILYAYANKDYKTRPSVEEIIHELKKFKRQ